MQLSRSTTNVWPSLPASMGASGGNGYGPGSLSSGLSKFIVTFGCVPGTVSNGMPYDGSLPKSGCTFVLPPFMLEMYASDIVSAVAPEISRFQYV